MCFGMTTLEVPLIAELARDICPSPIVGVWALDSARDWSRDADCSAAYPSALAGVWGRVPRTDGGREPTAEGARLAVVAPCPACMY